MDEEPFVAKKSFMTGGDLVSTGIADCCWRAGVVWGPVNKPGAYLFGESNYAMAA